MRTLSAMRRLPASVLTLAIAAAACSSSERLDPTTLKSAPASPRNALGANGNIAVCKVAGPPGTYHFHIDVSGGGNFRSGPDTAIVFDGANTSCWPEAYSTIIDASWTPGLTASITVTETQIPSSITVDSIELTDRFGDQQATALHTASIVFDEGATDIHTVRVFNASLPSASCVAITAVMNQAITPVTMLGSGGSGGPYTFSAVGLPTGLTMSADGTISGTPTVSGTFNYTVSVTDKNGHTGTVNCSVTVSPPAVCNDIAATNYGGPLPCEYPPPCPGGSFSYSFVNGSGDLFITYDQFPAPNDNSYGTNAVGWPNGHKFSDLTGSDHAGFQLVDGTGTVKLSFNVDYLSASTSAPSGYASLGVTGGDGKMLVGTSDGITATTSLANNLNNVNIPGLFNASHVQQFGSVNVLVNSPPTDALHQTYVNSDPTLAGWDFHDTYFVTISAAKLASIGYDPSTWSVQPNADQLHNSPAKACPTTTGSCNLSETKVEVKDKQVKMTIMNGGASAAYLSDLILNWPVSNGKLMQVKLDADIVYDRPDIAGGSAHLTLAQLVADQNKRKIDHGKSRVLTFVFEKNADTALADYSSTATFGTCPLVVLPK